MYYILYTYNISCMFNTSSYWNVFPIIQKEYFLNEFGAVERDNGGPTWVLDQRVYSFRNYHND